MAPAPCPSLPQEAWRLILEHLTARQRMRCSRVCQRLHRAAVAATKQLQLSRYSIEQADSFKLYLSSHGRHLRELKVRFYSGDRVLAHLPCPNLQDLFLDHCTLQLCASESCPGLLHGCSSLRQLFVSACKVVGPKHSLTALAGLTQLQHLQLTDIGGSNGLIVPRSLLQPLTQLSFLKMSSFSEGLQGCLQHLSGLASLQLLNLRTSAAVAVSPSTTPGFSKLAALTSITLTGCTLDPAVLSGCTQLSVLDLRRVALPLEDHAGDAGMLLSCIARMPRLQHLTLQLLNYVWPEDLAAYSGLTASSNLQHLQLGSKELPGGIWQEMFPWGKTWPSLQVLKAPEWNYQHSSDTDSDDIDDDDDVDLPASACSLADIRHIAACCPALQHCTICIDEDVSLRPFAQLQQLRDLNVHGVSDYSMRSLAQLTQLTWLCPKVAQGVTPQSVFALTALRELKFLYISHEAVGYPEEMEEIGNLYSSLATTANFWQQLMRQCAGNKICQPLVINHLFDQVTEQQQQLAEQQQYIKQLQQQVTEQPPPQQPMSAAAAQADQMQARVLALEGQVQQLMQALQQRNS